jgi:hypothetical protein
MTGGPKCAVSPHEAVGRALLAAHVLPAADPPDGYNDRRGALWARLLANRTLPKSKEFETEWGALRAMLVQAGAETPGHHLGAPLDALDRAWGAACQSGLVNSWS